MKVKIVNESINPLPEVKTAGSSGVDLMSNMSTVICPNSTELIGTGLYVECPVGYEFQIRSRSGLAGKHGIFVLNSPGTIDSDYRGEIKVLLHNVSNNSFNVNIGDRIAQMCLCPIILPEFEEVENIEDLSNTDRGDGGFGHTGIRG